MISYLLDPIFKLQHSDSFETLRERPVLTPGRGLCGAAPRRHMPCGAVAREALPCGAEPCRHARAAHVLCGAVPCGAVAREAVPCGAVPCALYRVCYGCMWWCCRRWHSHILRIRFVTLVKLP